MKKKIFACALIIVVLAVSIFPVFAETYVYTMVYTREYQQNVRDEGANTLQDYYDIYYNALNAYSVSVMYFEFMWMDLNVEMPPQVTYFPSQNSWSIPYGYATSDNSAGGNPLIRFYVTSGEWDFEIRTTNNNFVLFDSSLAAATRTSDNRYYYTFTVELQALMDSMYGWYIYSDEICPFYTPNSSVTPPYDPGPFDVRINYYDIDGGFVSQVVNSYSVSTEPILITIPPINGFIIEDENIRDSGYVLERLVSDVSIRITVLSYTQYGRIQYDLGKSIGYESGKDEGYALGYAKGEEIGLSNGEQIGYWKGVEDANDGNVIVNPLTFVLEPVEAFLNMQFVKGLSIGVMFLAVFVFGIVLLFLKIFAGG